MKAQMILALSIPLLFSESQCTEEKSFDDSRQAKPLSEEQLNYIRTDGESVLNNFERVINS